MVHVILCLIKHTEWSNNNGLPCGEFTSNTGAIVQQLDLVPQLGISIICDLFPVEANNLRLHGLPLIKFAPLRCAKLYYYFSGSNTTTAIQYQCIGSDGQMMCSGQITTTLLESCQYQLLFCSPVHSLASVTTDEPTCLVVLLDWSGWVKGLCNTAGLNHLATVECYFICISRQIGGSVNAQIELTIKVNRVVPLDVVAPRLLTGTVQGRCLLFALIKPQHGSLSLHHRRAI